MNDSFGEAIAFNNSRSVAAENRTSNSPLSNYPLHGQPHAYGLFINQISEKRVVRGCPFPFFFFKMFVQLEIILTN